MGSSRNPNRLVSISTLAIMAVILKDQDGIAKLFKAQLEVIILLYIIFYHIYMCYYYFNVVYYSNF